MKALNWFQKQKYDLLASLGALKYETIYSLVDEEVVWEDEPPSYPGIYITDWTGRRLRHKVRRQGGIDLIIHKPTKEVRLKGWGYRPIQNRLRPEMLIHKHHLNCFLKKHEADEAISLLLTQIKND